MHETRARWIGVAAAVASVVLCGAPSFAATVRSLQSGTATSSANGTLTVTIAAVDTTKAALFFETRHNSNRPVASTVRGKLSSSTTIDFVRVTNEAPAASIVIQWYVVEWASGVSVQRGETTQSATTVNVTISAVTAVAQSFVTWSKTPVSTDNQWGSDDFIVAELTSTTNLQIRSSALNASHTIAWQVVAYSASADINVQKGSISTMTGTTTSVTATLSPAVNTGHTFVLVGARNGGAGDEIGPKLVRARLTNSTTVTIDRSVTGKTSTSLLDAWTTGTTKTVSAGSNRLLVVAVGYENATDTGVSSVTYGTRSLTRITGTSATSSSVFNRTELWYLNDANISAASSTTIAVTWGNGAPTDAMYAAATFANVEQGTPVGASNTSSTNAATPNPLTAAVSVEPRGYSVAAVTCGNSGTYTWNNGWAAGTDQTSSSTTEMATASNDESTSGTDTASATHSGPNRQAMVVAYLNPLFEDDIDEITWQAVELKDGSTVQNGSASFAAGASQSAVSLGTSVDTAASVAFTSAQSGGGQNGGRSPYTADDLVGVSAFTAALTATTVTLDRASTVDTADVGWFVVQFKRRRVVIMP